MITIRLNKQAQELLLCSDNERIEFIMKDKWINYPSAQEVFDLLDNIKTYEKNKTRVTSILLVASSNNGKTYLLQEFINRNKPYDYYTENQEKLTREFFDTYNTNGIPALYVLAPSEPSETRLYSNILNTLNVPYKERDSISKKQYLVEYYLEHLNVDMLIIDEIHNILSGSVAKQKQVLNAIKNLSNNLKIPIVLAGTKDALRAISTDRQISSRFRPVYLKRWEMNKEYTSLLASLLSMLPLRKESKILTPNTAMEILEMTGGYIGDIIGLLKQASVYAIETKSERISLQEIKDCNYTSVKDIERSVNLNDL